MVQPVERDRRHGVRGVLDQRHGIEPRADPRQAGARPGRAGAHPREPCGGRLHQPVRRNVVRELVVLDFQRHGEAEPAPELLLDADAAANGMQRFLLGPIPVQQSGGERLPRGRLELQRQQLHDVLHVPEVEAVLQLDPARGVGRQKEHARNGQLGTDRNRHVADFERADGGARRQIVPVLRAGLRLDGDRPAERLGQPVALVDRERNRFAALVFPQVNLSHR